jgi:hypothetical protein
MELHHAAPQGIAFFPSEGERLGEQLRHAICCFRNPAFAVLPRVRKQVVHFVGGNAGNGATHYGLTVRSRDGEQIVLHKETDPITVHIDEGENLAVANVCPTQGAGISRGRPEVIGTTLTFEVNHSELCGNAASGIREGLPVET